MYDTEGNVDHFCIHDNLFNCRSPHHHIHLKEKKQVKRKEIILYGILKTVITPASISSY